MGFGKGKGFSPVIPPPVIPEPGVQSEDCQLEHDMDRNFCQYWNANSQTFTPDHDYVAVGISLLLTQFYLITKGPLIVKLELPAANCWQAEVLWSQALYSTSLPWPGNYRWTSFVLPEIALSKDITYRITVHTTWGWYRWLNGEWVEGEAYAGITWRAKGATNPYPRGKHCTGCNYRDGSHYWSCDDPIDTAFCLRIIEAPNYKTIDRGCPAGSDDCYTFGTTMRLTYDYLYVDYETLDMHAYARFTAIPIPPGATIIHAYIDLQAYAAYTGVSALRILGIKELDTATFSTQADADGRPVTDALVNWTPGNWAANGWYGLTNDPQDIKAIIEEIIGQAGWASGNALAIKIINTAQGITRTCKSREGGNSPRLYIEYLE